MLKLFLNLENKKLIITHMNFVTDVILPLALAFIMFVLGLGLTGADFLRVL